MRYSFIVLLHTVFEARLRSFCAALQREKHLPLGMADLRGHVIEQACTFLTKLVGITVADFDEWQELRTFQKVRNCIAHSFGRIDFADHRHKTLVELAKQNQGLSIADDGRLVLDASFCMRHQSLISSFFKRLFLSAGWQI